MAKVEIGERDPSWDDDWRDVLPRVQDEIEEEHPPDPRQAVQYFQYGFAAGRKHPSHEWPEVEQDLYEDYMTGVSEPPDEQAEGWQIARAWAHRGFEAGQAYRERPHIHRTR